MSKGILLNFTRFLVQFDLPKRGVRGAKRGPLLAHHFVRRLLDEDEVEMITAERHGHQQRHGVQDEHDKAATMFSMTKHNGKTNDHTNDKIKRHNQMTQHMTQQMTRQMTVAIPPRNELHCGEDGRFGRSWHAHDDLVDVKGRYYRLRSMGMKIGREQDADVPTRQRRRRLP